MRAHGPGHGCKTGNLHSASLVGVGILLAALTGLCLADRRKLLLEFVHQGGSTFATNLRSGLGCLLGVRRVGARLLD